MEATYKLNTQELTSGFITSLQHIYPGKDIEITVCEAEEAHDETEYLLSNPVMRERLLGAAENVRQGRQLISFETVEEAERCALEMAGRKRSDREAEAKENAEKEPVSV